MKEGKINGIQLFDILPDGCLNGVYINFNNDEVLTDSAKKIDGSNNTIEGEYLNTYFNRENEKDISICNGNLKIERATIDDKKYKLTWFKNGHIKDWEGEGWRIKDNQMIVVFWKH